MDASVVWINRDAVRGALKNPVRVSRARRIRSSSRGSRGTRAGGGEGRASRGEGAGGVAGARGRAVEASRLLGPTRARRRESRGLQGWGLGAPRKRARAGTGRRAPRSARREAPRAARGSGARGRDAHLADGLRDDLEAAGAARGPAARRALREPPASLLAAHETHRPRLRARGRRRDRAARRRGGARRRHRTRHVNRRHRNRRHRVCRSSHDPAKRDDECPSRLARGAPPDRRVAKKRTRKPVWMRHFRRGR